MSFLKEGTEIDKLQFLPCGYIIFSVQIEREPVGSAMAHHSAFDLGQAHQILTRYRQRKALEIMRLQGLVVRVTGFEPAA